MIEFNDLSYIPAKDLFDSTSETEVNIDIRRWLLGIDPNYEFGETVFESYTTNNSNYTEYLTELTVYSNAGDSVTCSDKIERSYELHQNQKQNL